MNLDNQLILGVIFITAGIALGLLAYAAFLNRESPEEELDLEDRAEGEIETAGDENQAASEPAAESAPTVQAPEEEPGAQEIQTVPSPAAETRAADRISSPIPEAAHDDKPVDQEQEAPEDSAGTTPVQIRRDEISGRIVVDVEDTTYRSIEDLRESEDWRRVHTLFSDILAWLIKEETSPPPTKSASEDVTAGTYPEESKSMIDQINEVLEQKLSEREGGPLAVRLAEGLGGSIRVYIGVESYRIDDVPDDEVRAIIRQAVKEWEARQ